ncbi:FAD:protein FMN transferase [Thalassovita sp.]|uniref:FAD:protein FMN transferase n=1 Tax=Thalassovita sp. TaxID=1979401 RepID=UPI0029DE5359|nr:FAD:protein FMN transferase [Thalassovita sp.]
MITRRRLLAISAACLACPATAAPVRWQGRALGAEAHLTFHAPEKLALAALRAVRQEIATAEALFSLFTPVSALSLLNAQGALHQPAPDFTALMTLAGTAHHLTGGAFDPTIQPLWQALTRGTDIAAAAALIGWDHVHVSADRITLGKGQQLSLNGIAQGYITDMVARRLRALGLHKVLVNIGEFAAIGGPWRLGISDPEFGLVGTRILSDRAIATSSARATTLRGRSHILDPGPGGNGPLWSTASVEADSATLADALSTAFILLPLPRIQHIVATAPERLNVVLAGFDGQIHTL